MVRIRISNTDKPFLRLGYSNIIVPIAFGTSFFAYLASRNGAQTSREIALLTAAGVFLLLIYWYLRAISEVEIKGNILRFVLGNTTNEFDVREIKWVRTFVLWPSLYVMIFVKKKTQFLPCFYHFSFFHSNVGGFAETVHTLRDGLAEAGLGRLNP